MIRLQTYLALIVSLLVVLAISTFGAYTAYEQSEMAEASQREIALVLGRNMASSLVADILQERYDSLENDLFSAARFPSVKEVSVANPAGNVISHVAKSLDGTPKIVWDYRKMTFPPQGEERIHELIDSQGNAGVEFFLPITNGSLLGWVYLRIDLAALDQVRAHIWRDTAISIAVFSLLAVLVLIAFLRIPVEGIEKATAMARSLDSAGNTQPHLKTISWISEISTLNHALNQSASRLHQQHRAVLDSKAMKDAILQSALDCILTVDGDGRVVEFNPAAERTFGYTHQQAIGRSMAELIIPPALREAHYRGMQRFRQGNGGTVVGKRIEITAMRADGSEFPVELTITPFHLGDKLFFTGYLRDISERKALENANQEVTEELRYTLRDLEQQKFALDEHAIVSITDVNGTIRYANDKFVEISQYAREELIGRNHRLIKSGLHSPAFYEDMWRTISSGQPWHGEIANRRKDGTLYWVASSIVPFLDESGLPYQYVSIRTDISAQKKIETQLAQLRESELNIGSRIQESLLLGEIPERLEGIGIAAESQASQRIDGDFYEFFRHRPQCFDVVVGDVMGKGVPAALMGAATKTQLNRSLSHLLAEVTTRGALPAPEAVINEVHRRITPHLMALDAFVTLAYLRIDTEAGTLKLVDAGHMETILHTPGSSTTRLLRGDNLPLGVKPDENYQSLETPITMGDWLVLYSDGVTEARRSDGELFGSERLVKAVERNAAAGMTPQQLSASIKRELRIFQDDAPFADDLTLVTICLKDQPETVAALTDCTGFPSRLRELEHFRQFLNEALGRAEPPLAEEAASAVELAAVEAATNIMRHAHGDLPDKSFTFVVHRQPAAMVLEYLYHGTPFDRAAAREPDFSGQREGGFGLFIIDEIMDRVEYSDNGKGLNRIVLEKTLVNS